MFPAGLLPAGKRYFTHAGTALAKVFRPAGRNGGNVSLCHKTPEQYNRVMRIFFYTIFIVALCVEPGCDSSSGYKGTSMLTSVEQSPWNTGHNTGVKLTSAHYDIYATTTNRVLLQYLPGFMEAAYENYGRISGLKDRPLEEHMQIYMMGSKEEWLALTQHIFREHSKIFMSIDAGGYCHQGICVFWDFGGLGTLAVASHEGFHQFLYHRMKNQLPMWVEEGLCVTAEGYNVSGDLVQFTPDRNTIRFTNLRTAIVQNLWVPVGRLLPMDGGDAVQGSTIPEAAVGYYGQLWALAKFLRSDPKYSPGYYRLLADAEAGEFYKALDVPPHAVDELRAKGRIYNRVVSEKLFRHYITDDLDAFEREFYDFACKLTGLR